VACSSQGQMKWIVFAVRGSCHRPIFCGVWYTPPLLLEYTTGTFPHVRHADAAFKCCGSVL
jgi:hypothetical protein